MRRPSAISRWPRRSADGPSGASSPGTPRSPRSSRPASSRRSCASRTSSRRRPVAADPGGTGDTPTTGATAKGARPGGKPLSTFGTAGGDGLSLQRRFEEVLVTSLTEVLVVRGHLPVDAIDSIGDGGDDEARVRGYLAAGAVTPAQVAMARAAQLGFSFVELTERTADPAAI